MKNKKYYINLTEQERSQIIHSLIDKKNEYSAKVEHPDRFELNSATAGIEQCDRKGCTLTD